jgi:catechol 2,3-dioxygenase-like lactoylglutathione lyase family enzyme
VPITGVHTLFHTPEPDALRAVIGDVFGWPHVDAGGGWLIFALPPAEMGVHPGEEAHHEISFLCDDIEATVAELQAKGIEFDGTPTQRRFGITIDMVLPGGVRAMLYQPHHPIAAGMPGPDATTAG